MYVGPYSAGRGPHGSRKRPGSNFSRGLYSHRVQSTTSAHSLAKCRCDRCKGVSRCKLPTTEVVGFPPQGVSAHASSTAEGGLHDGGSVTRRGFLRGVPTRGLRPKPSHTALLIGGLPSFHRRLIRRERRGVIRPRCQGVLTNAPPRSTRLADRECAYRYGTREHNSNGGETGVLSPEERVEPVGFLPRLTVVGFRLELL